MQNSRHSSSEGAQAAIGLPVSTEGRLQQKAEGRATHVWSLLSHRLLLVTHSRGEPGTSASVEQ